MAVKNEENNLNRLTREFGNKVLVVSCKPENREEVFKMLSNIPPVGDVYEAMGKVGGPVESYHVEALSYKKT
jgi:hypothetical protein